MNTTNIKDGMECRALIRCRWHLARVVKASTATDFYWVKYGWADGRESDWTCHASEIRPRKEKP